MEARSFQSAAAQVEPAQIGLTKVAVGKIDIGDVRAAQIDAAKVATAKVARSPALLRRLNSSLPPSRSSKYRGSADLRGFPPDMGNSSARQRKS
jgi:hypothetical protein